MSELAQPLVEKIEIVGGLYFRSVFLPVKGISIPQHIHDYDHVTLVCSGRARGWRGEENIGDKQRGEAFEILNGQPHRFESLEDGTMLTCVHNVESAVSIQRRGL